LRGIPVVPVLLDGAAMPEPERLPEDIRKLVRRQAEFVEFRTFEADVARLIKRLRLEQLTLPSTQNKTNDDPPEIQTEIQTERPQQEKAENERRAKAQRLNRNLDVNAPETRQQKTETQPLGKHEDEPDHRPTADPKLRPPGPSLGSTEGAWTFFFGFNGRINRAKFWLAMLAYSVVAIVLLVIALAVGSTAFTVGVGVIGLVIITVSSVATTLKRLHDRNKSALWLLIFYLLPNVLTGIGAAIDSGASGSLPTGVGMVFSLIGTGLSIWALVEFGCLRGTVGTNQYGPDPLEGKI
jgi:uncharacterized membrane protein YhaH (DUF805 family)